QGQLRRYLPIVLNIPAVIRIGLPDQAGRLQPVGGWVSKQERREGVAGVVGLIIGDGSGKLRKREASVGPVLPASIPAVPGVEEARLDGVGAADPGEVVSEIL